MNNPIKQAIIAARRRIILQKGLLVFPWLGLGGLGLAAGVLLMGRLFAIPVPDWIYVAIGAGVAVAGVGVMAWRWPSDAVTAAWIDQQLGLKDQLASALFAYARYPDNPFAGHVVDQATQLAGRLSIPATLPLRLTKPWGLLPLAGVALGLIAVLVPPMDLLGRSQAQTQQQSQQRQADTAKQHIDQSLAAVRTTELGHDPADPSSAAPNDALQTLSQIQQADLTQPQTRSEAAAKLSQLQDRLEDQTQQHDKLLQTLRNTMSRLEQQEPGPADPLVESLRRGDFQDAQAQARALAKAVESMSPQERQALQQQLQHLAGQMQQAADQHAQQESQSAQQLEHTLSRAQPSGQPQDPATTQPAPHDGSQAPIDPQALERRLVEQGHDPQDARRIAQKAQEIQQQQRRHQESQQQCEGLSSALDQKDRSSNQDGQWTQGQPNPNQPPAATSPKQSLEDAADQLERLVELQQQLDQMRQAQRHTQQAIENLSTRSANPTAGAQEGGDPLGAHRQVEAYQAQGRGDSAQDFDPQGGQSITWWRPDGHPAKGPATVQAQPSIPQAQRHAEQALTEDRVPRRYHQAVRRYFNQIPRHAEDAPPPSPPTQP